jgi:NAD/NADP transhydrogenase beta subunit
LIHRDSPPKRCCFAKIDNPVFHRVDKGMVLGDAKKTTEEFIENPVH